MKPIETRYNGCRFRSRLEARWAVFMDALGVQYRYEHEGWDLDGVWYLPDFWLPQKRMWLEIKGTDPTASELAKAAMLSRGSKKQSLVFCDLPGCRDGWHFYWYLVDGKQIGSGGWSWADCPLCGEVDVVAGKLVATLCACHYTWAEGVQYAETPHMAAAITAARYFRF